jgi:hypothetical protein
MDSPTRVAALGSTNKPPTIASRRPMLSSQKSFSVLSINTSATHNDLLRRNSSATTSNSRQRRLQTPTSVPPLPLSASGNMSPEELSSKIADSFQQFSSMLSQLSNNKSPVKATNNSTTLTTPVTPTPLNHLYHPTSQQTNNNHTTSSQKHQQQHNTTIVCSPSPLSSPPKNNKFSTNNATAAQNDHRKEVRPSSHPTTATNVIQQEGKPSTPFHRSSSLENNLPQVKCLHDSGNEGEKEEDEEEGYRSRAIYFENALDSLSTKTAINKGYTRLRRRLISKWFTRAASTGDIEIMQQMLNTIKDIDINCTDDKKTCITSLMYASYFGHGQCLNLLLQYPSIRINQQDNSK